MHGAGTMVMPMMHRGMMGHGPHGPRALGPDFGHRVTPMRHLEPEDVRHFLEHRLAREGHERLRVGEVSQAEEDTIVADIETVDGSLVKSLRVDRHTGVIGGRPAPAMMKPMKAMQGMQGAPEVPPVTGYAVGEKILFLHTETSDREIARVLTEMMGSPVLVVPSLAEVTAGLLAPVYVFKNGLEPSGPRGPLGFQPDVFPSPPGKAGYTPLRQVVFVTWTDDGKARLLTSAEQVEQAAEAGEVTFQESGVVVNMPLVVWPGGRR